MSCKLQPCKLHLFNRSSFVEDINWVLSSSQFECREGGYCEVFPCLEFFEHFSSRQFSGFARYTEPLFSAYTCICLYSVLCVRLRMAKLTQFMQSLQLLQYFVFHRLTSEWELGFGHQVCFDPTMQQWKTQNDKHHRDECVGMKHSKDNFMLTCFALLLGKLYVS